MRAAEACCAISRWEREAAREALAVEADVRRGAEIAAGEERAALATLREEYAAATEAQRRVPEHPSDSVTPRDSVLYP